MKQHKQQWNGGGERPVNLRQAELWRQQTAGQAWFDRPQDLAPPKGVPPQTEPPRGAVRNPWIENLPRRRAHSRKGGLAVFSLCLAGMLTVTGVYWAVCGRPARPAGDLPGAPEGHYSALNSHAPFTSIPRTAGGETRLAVQTDHGEALTASEVFERVNPAVVTVLADQELGTAVGTGVIFSEEGYFLTNAHVIEDGLSCTVLMADGRRYDALLVGYDQAEDVAVLKIVGAEDLPVAEIGDSDSLSPGDPAYAIGNPLGIELRNTLTDGIISAVDRDVEVDGRTMTLIQTNAALNEGNSGGPLINQYGQVVGLNTIKMSARSGEVVVEGLGFAIPSRTVEYLTNQILQYGKTMPTALGITVTPRPDAAKDEGGILVYSVTPGSCSDEAGVCTGDIILAADGAPLYETDDLLAARWAHIPGDTMVLTILRGGEELEIAVVLDAA